MENQLSRDQDQLKKSRILETLTLSTCADNSIVSKKLNKTFVFNLEHVPVLKALRRADPEQNARTIHESNSEHLLVLRLHAGHHCFGSHSLKAGELDW